MFKKITIVWMLLLTAGLLNTYLVFDKRDTITNSLCFRIQNHSFDDFHLLSDRITELETFTGYNDKVWAEFLERARSQFIEKESIIKVTEG